MAAPGAKERSSAPGSLTFDWTMVALIAWCLGGLYADGWAHNHLGAGLESFFTPWHLAFYSGFVAITVLTFLVLFHNRAREYAWRRALPDGYNLALIGELIFLLGGCGDLIWHELFGIETNVEALLSPSHLQLAVGLALIVSGPFRARWRRGDMTPGWKEQVPMLLSLTYLLSVLTFILQFAYPLERPWAAAGNRPIAASFPVAAADPPLTLADSGVSTADLTQVIGVTGMLVTTTLLLGLMLVVVYRWGARLLAGGLTLMVGLNALAMGIMRDEFRLVLAIALGGLASDLLLKVLRPSGECPLRFRWFAVAVPLLLWGCYFAALALTGGIWWTIHLWAGSLMLAGITGWLLSYAFVPPPTRGWSDP
jgi:hypothetical protein